MVRQESANGVGVDISDAARRHYDAVYRFCARQIGQEHAADAAQETFVTAQRVAQKFRGDSSLSTWLIGIALNECRRIVRRRRVEPPMIELDPERASPLDPEKSIVNREALRSALDRLGPEHREVVVLHELQGMTYLEIAQVLNVPEGTLKSRLHHAFRQMRASVFGEQA